MAFFTKAKTWQRNRKEHKPAPTPIEALPTVGASLLTLPMEIRLSIFEHVFDNQLPVTLFSGSDTISLARSIARVTSEAPNQSIPSNRTALFRVCRRIREEAEDAFFKHTLFGIIASPYQAHAKVPHDEERR